MIDRSIEWALRNRVFVVCATLLFVGLGLQALYRTPVDAVPDLSENQVVLFTEWEGRSAQDVEDQVTYPLVTRLQGITGIKSIRGSSMFGLSFLTLVFEDSIDPYFCRGRILERLDQLRTELPAGVVPEVGPDANGLGWIYQYYFHVDSEAAPNGGYDLGHLRAVQDWYVRYHLSAIEEVAEVAGIGGFERQYQVAVSSHKLKALKLPLARVVEAVAGANLNVGGSVLEENGLEFVVQGVGLLDPKKTIQQLEEVMLAEREGTPVFLRQVAEISLGGAFRRGVLEVDGSEVVGGIVVMRTGADASTVTRAVKERIAALTPGLPKGVTIRGVYDRSDLIDRTVATLADTLWKEVLLVTLAHVIFLWHFRSVLIVTLPLPLSILGGFLAMRAFGVNSNLMSLGGIAIAIGVLVDAGIVMTENVLRSMEQRMADAGRPPSAAERIEITIAACRKVGRPLFFAMLIVTVGFIPVFALQGAEGRLFQPLALTKTFAMVASVLLAVTLVPVLCSLLAGGEVKPEGQHWLMRRLAGIYEPILMAALRWKRALFAAAAGFFGLGMVLTMGLPDSCLYQLRKWGMDGMAARMSGLGSEFMPELNEGSLLLMPVMAPGVALTDVAKVMSWQNEIIRQSPEVLTVAGKAGRADTATDPAPVEMIETTIQLKPRFVNGRLSVLGLFDLPYKKRNPHWRPGVTTDSLVAEWTRKLSQLPGSIPGFLQPIENRILMLNTGIRGQVGVSVLGDDAEAIQNQANKIRELVKELPGATGVVASRQQGQPYLKVTPLRRAVAVQGLDPADVMAAVDVGIGGREVTTVYAGRERIPVQVRLQRSERTDIERLQDILVSTTTGEPMPLGMLTKIERTSGPSVIESEDGLLRAYVQMNVRGRDLGGFVEDLKRLIDSEVTPNLPPRMAIAYSGRFEDQLRARSTMQWVIPLSVLGIFMLLLLVYRSSTEAAHVLLAIPFAVSGGMMLQYLLGYPFSVAVWVGYIALFGTAIQTTMVMVVYLEHAVAEKRSARGTAFDRADLLAAVREGALLRLRPKLMTVATIIASLLPLMVTERTGAEVMQPLATPIIGGMVSSLFHVLVVTPVLFYWLRERELQRSA